MKTYYQDDEVVVTDSAIIKDGRKIPMSSVKRVESKQVSKGILPALGWSNSELDYGTHLMIEHGILRTKTVLAGSSLVTSNGTNYLSSLTVKHPSNQNYEKMLEIVDSQFGSNFDKAVPTLENDPGLNRAVLFEIRYALDKHRRLEKIHSAVQKAMAGQ